MCSYGNKGWPTEVTYFEGYVVSDRGGGEGRGTPTNKPYRCVPPQRVSFSSICLMCTNPPPRRERRSVSQCWCRHHLVAVFGIHAVSPPVGFPHGQSLVRSLKLPRPEPGHGFLQRLQEFVTSETEVPRVEARIHQETHRGYPHAVHRIPHRVEIGLTFVDKYDHS